MGTANGKRKHPDDPTREVFEAARSGDAVLLNEVLLEMNSSERASVLETKIDAILRYDADDVCEYDKFRATPLTLAAKHGNVDCVKVLLNYKADIENRGCSTPLIIVAVTYGNLDVLSCLVENGADVNARSNYHCTPLMIASKCGHVTIVTFLIEHGANMNLQDKKGNTALHYAVLSSDHDSCVVLNCFDRYGADFNACAYNNRTPLMKASLKGHANAVTFLIEHGANMDLQDNNGDTALHYAVNGNSSEVACKLLSLGASQLCNRQGLTAILSASNKCKISVVEDLITRPQYTKEQRIDALELLGASLVTVPHSEEGFQYIKRGMEERFADPSHPLFKQSVEPVEAYQNRKESQTLEELAQIEGDVDAITIEGLIIRERILGTNNAELLGPIRRVSQYYYNFDGIFILIRLCRHAMKIAKHCNESAISDLNRLTSLLSYQSPLWSNDLPREEVLLELLDQTVLEYEKQQKSRRGLEKQSHELQIEIKLKLLFDSTKNLVRTLAKFNYCEEGKTSTLLKRLCRLNPRDRQGDTLLHKAVVKDHMTGLFPCIDTMKLLLNAGLNVNAVNNNGDTPLHRAVTFVPSNDKIHLLTDMLEALLDGGAHPDFVNNDGKTAIGLAKTCEAHKIISERRNLELKCLSARAVRMFGLHYLGFVPTTLEKFISMH